MSAEPRVVLVTRPTALQEQFAAARTVEEGKPTITLTLDGGVA